MKKNDWKDRLNIVYSTNPDFSYQLDEEEEPGNCRPETNKTEGQYREKRTEAEKPLPSFQRFIGRKMI